MIQSEKTLLVHSIESFGIHDGPGIRLVIFLQGCNIKCLYCQNPDTISLKSGNEIKIDSLVKRALNMKSYFGEDGGITVSGGEPLLQSETLIPFFLQLKKEGIHTNIDTNGTVVNKNSIKLIKELADLVMFDIKHATAEGFQKLVGKGLFKQSEKLIALREDSNKPFWFRYVLIPGYTDDPKYLKIIGEKYEKYKNIERFQVLPYHQLGIYKWEVMGERYLLEAIPENTKEQVEAAKNILKGYFKNVI